MKKIDSIDYGGKVIGIGLIFLVGIPGILFFINRVCNNGIIHFLIWTSLVIGVIIEIGFGCFLGIELRQDRIIGRYYEKHPSSQKTSQDILDEHRRMFKKR